MPQSAGGQRSPRQKFAIALGALASLAATVFLGFLAAHAIRESVAAEAREGEIQSVRIVKSRVVTAQAALDVHRVVVRLNAPDRRGGAVELTREHGYYEETDARKDASGLRAGGKLTYFVAPDGTLAETRRIGRAVGLSALALLFGGAALGLARALLKTRRTGAV